MRPLFRSPGGKYFARNQLLPLIPNSRAYVEPFAGSAALLFGKGRVELEVLADIDEELIETFRFVQSASDEELLALAEKDWTGSAIRFQKLRNSRPKSPLERAYRFLYVRRFGGGVDFSSFVGKPSAETKYHFHYLAQVRDRLKDVKLEVADFEETIKKWDDEDVFFYLDPPFLMTARRGKWTEADQSRLIACLKSIKGRFLLSQDANTFKAYKDIYEEAGFDFASFNVRTEIEGKLFTRHYTIANYKIGAVEKTSSLEIQFLGTKGDIELSERKHRHNAATLFRYNGKSLLVDFGKSFQGQPLPSKNILLTHAHDDHFGGLIGRKLDVPVLVSPLFKKSRYYNPKEWQGIRLKEYPLRRWFRFAGVRILAVPVLHSAYAENVALFMEFPGGEKVALATDVLALRKPDRRFMKGYDVYIGDGSALRKAIVRQVKDIPIGHQSIAAQISWAQQAGIKTAIFTHFGEWALKLDERRLKKSIAKLANQKIKALAAFDGMKVKIGKVRKEVQKVPFYLHEFTFKGPIHIRFGPTERFWALTLDLRKPKLFRLILERSILVTERLWGAEEPLPRTHKVKTATWVRMKWKKGPALGILEVKERVGLAPKQPLNPTKNTPGWMELVDAGTATIVDRGRDYMKVLFDGKRLKGGFLFRKQEDVPFWDVTKVKGPVVKSLDSMGPFPIFKADAEKRLVYGVILEPYHEDVQKHTVEPADIEKALHRYMLESRKIGLLHYKLLPFSHPVEAYIAPNDLEFQYRGETHLVKKGSGVLVTKVGEQDVWERILAGELTGYSIHGKAIFIRRELPEHFLISEKSGDIIRGSRFRTKLKNIIIERVDIVRRPAIGRTFVLVKEEGGENYE